MATSDHAWFVRHLSRHLTGRIMSSGIQVGVCVLYVLVASFPDMVASSPVKN